VKIGLASVYLGLGANIGNRTQNFEKALDMLSQGAQVKQVSSFYETEPIGYSNQPQFLNAVCRISTSLSPEQLLALIKEIEATLGRKPSFRNAPRPIDIDILFYDEQIINSKELIIPHPRIEERAFVLIPLAELAPDMVNPANDKKVSEMLDNVEGRDGVSLWKERQNV
jgi:GTP cyclohydrolase-4